MVAETVAEEVLRAMQRNDRHIETVTGEIVLAQENRFRMETRDGRSLLIILGDGARSSIEDLERLVRSRQLVTVRYQGEPDAGATALEIKETG